MDIARISPKALRRKMTGGDPVLLVCGYDGEERFREMELEGAVSWPTFQSLRSSIPFDREIVFYCA
jgi:hypothetical protein